jgi:hypothetical protein
VVLYGCVSWHAVASILLAGAKVGTRVAPVTRATSDRAEDGTGDRWRDLVAQGWTPSTVRSRLMTYSGWSHFVISERTVRSHAVQSTLNPSSLVLVALGHSIVRNGGLRRLSVMSSRPARLGNRSTASVAQSVCKCTALTCTWPPPPCSHGPRSRAPRPLVPS